MMNTVYSNLAKGQVFPLAARVCLKPRGLKRFHTLKPYSLPVGLHSKPSINPFPVHFITVSHGFGHKSHKVVNVVRPTKTCSGLQWKSVEVGGVVVVRSASRGVRIRSSVHPFAMSRARSFSSYSQRVREGSRVVKGGKSLPWLSSNKVRETKGLEKEANAKNSRSFWGESVKRMEKVSNGSSWEESAKRLENRAVVKTGRSSWEESTKRLEKGTALKTGQSSWEKLTEDVEKNNSHMVGNRESGNRTVCAVKDKEIGSSYNEREDSIEEGEAEEELEAVDDPRWDKIKNRFRGMAGVKGRSEKPEFQRWNKQENWGRKTWKEATESTVPKTVGEGVYGLGPVLAALSAGRREFYALYVQEGLDFSSNNRKKKDKKGFEKVLRMAEKIGLTTKEVSKHDLNMIVDNRPHQGLVLDASSLEMVKIMELDAVLPKEGSLWVALDEVTDPQNLGAIIRSAYFFGASGVVLCAKNSAPLSGVVSKASAGSLELMELRYCKNMMQFLVSSAENGWRVLGGSVSSKAVPLNEVLPGQPTILVLGSEGTGLRPLVEKSCTQLVRIPGNIPVDVTVGASDEVEGEQMNIECSSSEFRSFLAVESLNVSVAAGVLLHHLIGHNNNENCHVGNDSTNVIG